MKPDAAMIFAAGFGTRMGALTKSTPKPLIKISNKPLIDYALDLVNAADVKTTVVNLHYLPEQIERHLENTQVKTLREAPDILETGGGLKNALPILGNDPVFTLNSDAVWTGANPLTLLRDHWNPETMDGLLALIPLENAQEYAGAGDFFLDQHGSLRRRGTSKTAPFVFSGAQIIKTDMLQSINKTSFSLNILWDEMLKNNRLHGVVHHGGWVDVGHPNGIITAENELAKHV
ncbi:nucleotidyltransferase [Amylibacter kogurei]|uniref:Nucleotidyltransferase n=1 Tax=Paramylibacter kogurei TaxID=1889778 RepID=A0A2G5KAF2_9RHOB|nr:nucleotidyltransferase family protein [Amylibacter kogurei]PIB26518.1 nucleotidyltransferase [Amylibacter kogurei]